MSPKIEDIENTPRHVDLDTHPPFANFSLPAGVPNCTVTERAIFEDGYGRAYTDDTGNVEFVNFKINEINI